MRGARHFGKGVIWLLLSCWFGMITAEAANASPPASAVERQVAIAIARDLHLDAAAIEAGLQVLAPFKSLPVEAGLYVVSVRQQFAPDAWLLRLHCASAQYCLPFDAVLHSSAITAARLDGRPPSQAIVATLPPSPLQGKTSGAAPLNRSGEQVEMVEDLSGVRMRAKAVCLQSGALGDRIRVRNLSTGRVLLAIVAGQGLVRVEP